MQNEYKFNKMVPIGGRTTEEYGGETQHLQIELPETSERCGTRNHVCGVSYLRLYHLNDI